MKLLKYIAYKLFASVHDIMIIGHSGCSTLLLFSISIDNWETSIMLVGKKNKQTKLFLLPFLPSNSYACIKVFRRKKSFFLMHSTPTHHQVVCDHDYVLNCIRVPLKRPEPPIISCLIYVSPHEIIVSTKSRIYLFCIWGLPADVTVPGTWQCTRDTC